MTKDELHILPTNVRPTCPYFTEKTGPTRQSNSKEEVDQSKTRTLPRSLPEHILLKRVTTKTLSTLILSKTYPSMGILSPLPRHAKLFWLWSCFAEKLLILNPYFQYFSSNWFDSYKLGSPISLEHTWLIILSFSNIQLNISISVSFHFFTTMWRSWSKQPNKI